MTAEPRRQPRTRSITAAAITAVLLASGVAVAANLGILHSTTNGPVGALRASDLSTPVAVLSDEPQTGTAPVDRVSEGRPDEDPTTSCDVGDDDHEHHDDDSHDDDRHDGAERYEGRDDDD